MSKMNSLMTQRVQTMKDSKSHWANKILFDKEEIVTCLITHDVLTTEDRSSNGKYRA